MKIKTFLFNLFSSCTDDEMHLKKQNMHNEFLTLTSPDKIDSEINSFIKDKNIIDIKITELQKSYSDLNKTNKISVLYTIIYN